METNQAQLERIVRVALGATLLALFFTGPKTLWGLLGVIPLLTGLVGFCPIYKVLGLSTCVRRT